MNPINLHYPRLQFIIYGILNFHQADTVDQSHSTDVFLRQETGKSMVTVYRQDPSYTYVNIQLVGCHLFSPVRPPQKGSVDARTRGGRVTELHQGSG